MLYAITSYFNPAGFQNHLTKYRVFRNHLAVPLITIELSFNGTFELNKSDADRLVQISGGAVVWQKERLLNLALEHLPADCDAVAWIDCDVLFDDPSWVADAERELQDNIMVQLFSRFVDLEPSQHAIPDSYEHAGRGLIYEIEQQGIDALERRTLYGWGHTRREVSPGLAWSIRRDVIDQLKFYDAMIMGAADRMILHAAYGRFSTAPETVPITDQHLQHYNQWAHRFNLAVQGNVGYIPHTIYHLWHGEIPNRGYWHRHKQLQQLEFDPDRDLRIGENGAWSWARPRPDIEAYAASYFPSRKEDRDL
jgi:hypothetical protein